MKVLHLITRLILGGAQENTVLSCEGLARQKGHEVILAHGPIYGPEGSLEERARSGGYELVELPDMIRAIRPGRDAKCYAQCRELIRRVKPDVVHTHSSKAGVLGRAAAWAERVPVVVHTIHGLAFHPYQGWWLNKPYIMAERWAAKRCHKIVSVADAMSRQALAAGIGTPGMYETIYSGMEVERFLDAPDDRAATRAEYRIADDEIVVGTVARLAELKGHDDLLDGLGPWLRAHAKVKLMWVGDGWWRDRLEQKVRALRLEDRVVITGMVRPDEVPRMIRAMDMLVHPSYREGLARALPQALLCGVPVVSYDCDGAGEVCIDGRTGRLAPTGDAAKLGEAIEWMIEHPEDRTRMGEAGREFCRERFDWRVMVDQLDALYRRLADAHGDR